MDHLRANEYRKKINEFKYFMKAFNQLPEVPCGVDNVIEIMNVYSSSELCDFFDTLETFHKKIEFFDFRPKKTKKEGCY